MAKKDEEYIPSDEDDSQFVPVMFARSGEEAERYRDLLEDHGVPAMIGSERDAEAEGASPSGPSMTHGVEVLVPEALLDEASEIIADREDLDEFSADDETDEEEDDDDKVDLSEELDPGTAGGLDEDDEDDFLDDPDEED